MVSQAEKLRRARSRLPGRPTSYTVDERLGFRQGRTADYERGKSNPSRDYLKRWDEEFGGSVPASYITDPRDNWPDGFGRILDVEMEEVDQAAFDALSRRLELPYYGDVPAGDWDEDETFRPGVEKVSAEFHHPDRFIRRISGDSMTPALRFGDKVHFHKSKQPRDGVIVLAQNGSGRTVKVARFLPKDRIWVLEAFNKDYSMPLDEWEMVGYLVTVRRIGPSGLQEIYHHDHGIKPDMLPSG